MVALQDFVATIDGGRTRFSRRVRLSSIAAVFHDYDGPSTSGVVVPCPSELPRNSSDRRGVEREAPDFYLLL